MSKRDMIGHWLDQASRYPLLTAAQEIELGAIVRQWQDYPGGADCTPGAIQRRGMRARERMVLSNLKLVVRVAKTERTIAPLEDLLQAGAMGLQHGVEKFDPTRGYRLSTYVYPWIRTYIQREQAKARIIAIPEKVAQALQSDNSNDSPQYLIDAARATVSVCSLDVQLDDDKLPLLGCRFGPSEDKEKEACSQLLEILKDWEKASAEKQDDASLIKMHYGIGCQPHSKAKIARLRRTADRNLAKRLANAEHRLRVEALCSA